MKPGSGGFLLALILSAAYACATDDPRKLIVNEFPSAALGVHGVILLAGPAYTVTQRYGEDFTGDTTGGFRNVRGVTTQAFGAGVEGAYDIAGALGQNHLLPGASFQVFPWQGTYYDDYAGEVVDNTHVQLSLRIYYGRSSDRFREVRHMVAAGPVANIFLWDLPGYGVRQSLAPGLGAGYYCVIRLDKRRSFVLAVSYRITYHTYWVEDLSMREYHHTLMVSAGMGF
jgi:hypothetical protein